MLLPCTRVTTIGALVDRCKTTVARSSTRLPSCCYRPNPRRASERDPSSRRSGTPSACWPCRPPTPEGQRARHRRSHSGRSRRKYRARRTRWTAVRTEWRNAAAERDLVSSSADVRTRRLGGHKRQRKLSRSTGSADPNRNFKRASVAVLAREAGGTGGADLCI